jgi:hypothetical protein
MRIPLLGRYSLRVGRNSFRCSVYANGEVSIQQAERQLGAKISPAYCLQRKHFSLQSDELREEEREALSPKLAAKLSEEANIAWWPELIDCETGEVVARSPLVNALGIPEDADEGQGHLPCVVVDGERWLQYRTREGETRALQYQGESLGGSLSSRLLAVEEETDAPSWKLFYLDLLY